VRPTLLILAALAAACGCAAPKPNPVLRETCDLALHDFARTRAGALSLDEWTNVIWSAMQRRADEDHDGRISYQEYLKVYRSPAGGRFDPGDFKALDRNRDGVLDRNDTRAVVASEFRRIDRNHDGWIDRTECMSRDLGPLYVG
jgi:Ca2+-binding EF-hand superfamily protein